MVLAFKAASCLAKKGGTDGGIRSLLHVKALLPMTLLCTKIVIW